MNPVNQTLLRVRNAFLGVVMCVAMFAAGYLFRHSCVQPAADQSASSDSPAGMTSRDDLQYFPPGAEFERTRQIEAIEEYRDRQEPLDSDEPLSSGVVVPASFEEPAETDGAAAWEESGEEKPASDETTADDPAASDEPEVIFPEPEGEPLEGGDGFRASDATEN